MVAIKNMKNMPKSCAECIIRHECEVADAWDEFDWNYNERCEGCPLVEIVTCKDCKHNKNGVCPNYRHFVDDDFYCELGERRE